MKCQNCGKNEVTFVYHSSVNGQVTEKRLCGECAERLGYTRRLEDQSQRMLRRFGSLFEDNMLGDFFSPMSSLPGWAGEDIFEDFFAEMPALRPVSERRQEQTNQKQEELLAKEEQTRFSELRQLNALRIQLKRAVQREEFEKAAELRDEIRALEARHKSA